MSPLTVVTVGCGGRGRVYSGLVAADSRYRLIGGADPDAARVAHVRAMSGQADFRGFASHAELFAAGRIADLAIIATQDSDHVEPAIRALELGYHILLEKPIAKDLDQVERVLAAAERANRRVLVCHVLRYTRLYAEVKRLIDSGAIGEVVDIEHAEGVGAFHQVHSFVRGHWSQSAVSSPMILAKCCHDTDILSWWMGQPCTRISSFGSLAYFRPERAPAGSTARCTDGCPHVGKCHYDAHRYLGDRRDWLGWVDPLLPGKSDAEITAWLREKPWGKCAWRAGNDVVDRQVVSMEFANGAVATLTMTAFDEGRHTTIRGTTALVRFGTSIRDLTGRDLVIEWLDGRRELRDVPAGVGGHGGGDHGMIAALIDEFAKSDPRTMTTGIHASVESHRIALAAEQSRLAGGRPVELAAP
ncbi:MAG: Gfo/Idh/MocA family oxidoreductase [Planctomycetes bacterium]|nr:Gfo/Idh/MocA family oxidoreductase [Planctomycetota bacterium]